MKDMEEEIIRDLVQESLEHLGLIEPLLLQAETDPSAMDADKLNHMFRALHSIKGGFSFVGKQNITRLSHAMENLLDRLRSGKTDLTRPMVEVFIRCVDVLRGLLDQVEASDQSSVEDDIARVNAFLAPPEAASSTSAPTSPSRNEPSGVPAHSQAASGGSSRPSGPSTAAVVAPAEGAEAPTFSTWPDLYGFDARLAEQKRAAKKFLYLLVAEKRAFGKTLPFRDWWETLGKLGEVLGASTPLESLSPLKSGKAFPLQVAVASILEPELMRAGVLHEGIGIRQWIPETPGVAVPADAATAWTPVPDPAPASRTPAPAVAAPAPAEHSPAGRSETPAADHGSGTGDSLRIRLDLLNRLFNLAGELVLTRNQLVQTLEKRMDQALTEDVQGPIEGSLLRAADGLRQLRSLDDVSRAQIMDLLAVMAGEIKETLGRTLGQKLSDAAGASLTVQTMNRITSELQESIMGMRMQPIHTLFTKFSRLVRDLSRKLGKEIDLTISGGDVELDKTILENLSDPLVHMIRNAGDHGLETPAEREAAGKSRRGTIHLNAYHQGGYVILEIKDDGRGIPAAKVRAKALEKGLISAEAAETLSDKDAHQLVFLPGFSTATQISDVSGRGVGMDVVKTNIEKLGGTVKIESAAGQGSTFILTLPLTLAIIPALMFSIEGRRLALPQVSVDEIIRVPAAEIGQRVTRVKDQEVLKLRGEILPLVRLTGILGVEPTFRHPQSGERLPDRRLQLADRRLAPEDKAWAEEPGAQDEEAAEEAQDPERLPGPGRRQRKANLYVVLVRAADLRFGVVVDRIHNMEEVVVKPLPTYLKQCRVYAGTTILGDGRVSLILDANGIVQEGKFRQVDADLDGARQRKQVTDAKAEPDQEFLHFSLGPEALALPSAWLERVIQVRADEIQQIGARRFVRYQEQNLQVLDPSDYLALRKLDAPPKGYSVLVLRGFHARVGLLCTGVHDIQHLPILPEEGSLRGTGMLGSFYVRNQVTIALEIHGLLEKAEPGVFPPRGFARWNGTQVALAERSAYFRELLKAYFESAGAVVLASADPDEAQFSRWKAQGVEFVLTTLSPHERSDEGDPGRLREAAAKADLPLRTLRRADGTRRDRDGGREKDDTAPTVWSKYALLAHCQPAAAGEAHHA